MQGLAPAVLISTYWNVNTKFGNAYIEKITVLISTYWNVNNELANYLATTNISFNLNLLECKYLNSKNSAENR